MKNNEKNEASKPDVITLMKTYNGSKYIGEQIESIMAQKHVNVLLYISDDGSTDDTVEKIVDFQRKYDNIFLVKNHQGEGPAQGYLNLVKYIVNEVDLSNYYVAYADQDDLWYQEKLITAVSNLKEKQADLFLSTYDVLRDGQKHVRNMGFDVPISIERVLAYWSPSGNVFVFTQSLATVLAKTNPKIIRMHDFWTLLIAVSGGFGIAALDKPLLMYRLHENNTVGLNKIGVAYFKNLYGSMKNDRNIRSLQATELLNQKDLLISDAKVSRTLKMFSQYRNSLMQRIALSRLKILGMNHVQRVLFKVTTLLGEF